MVELINISIEIITPIGASILEPIIIGMRKEVMKAS
jgi:hypothetical protein